MVEGDQAGVSSALARGGRPEVTLPTTRGDSWCLLGQAASDGYSHLLPCLVKAGLNLQGGGTADRTPLITAALMGHLGTVKALIKDSADPLATDSKGKAVVVVVVVVVIVMAEVVVVMIVVVIIVVVALWCC